MIYADLTGPILLAILTGTLYWMFGPKSKGNKNMSLKDIIDNDPVIKKLDKEIGDINDRADKRMKETMSESQLESFSEYGLSGAFTKEQVNDRKNQRIVNGKSERIEQIDYYLKNGFISESEKQYFLNYCIDKYYDEDEDEEKKYELSLKYGNDIAERLMYGEVWLNMPESESQLIDYRGYIDEESWNELFLELDDLINKYERRHQLSLVYDKEIAERLIKSEVWLNMTESQLNESRGYPDDREQELTPNGEIEVFIYGNKQSGSYFTLQDGKVIKIKDRQKKEY